MAPPRWGAMGRWQINKAAGCNSSATTRELHGVLRTVPGVGTHRPHPIYARPRRSKPNPVPIERAFHYHTIPAPDLQPIKTYGSLLCHLDRRPVTTYHGSMKSIDLTEPLQSILLGSMLGDGSIHKEDGSRSASYAEAHAMGQEAYTLWKMTQWGEYASKPSYTKAAKPTHQDQISFRLSRYPELLPWHDMFYGASEPSSDGKIRKKFRPDVIPLVTPLALAVWYMDDGSHQHWPMLSCHERSHPVGVAILAKFGIPTECLVGQSSRIVIRGDANARTFLDLIRPFVIPSMRNKLASGFLCRDQKTVADLIDVDAVHRRVTSGEDLHQVALDLKVPTGFVLTAMAMMGDTKGRQRTWPDADLHHLVTYTHTGRRPLSNLPLDVLRQLVDQRVHPKIMSERFGVSISVIKRELREIIRGTV